MTEQLINI